MKSFWPWFLLISLLAQPLWAGEAEDAAMEVGGQVKANWGSPESFSEKLADPIMTGSIPLTTLDGNSSGIAQISCPGTKTLFEILVQPGQTSDLTLVNVSYDSDIDGNLDSLLSVSIPVSGACANGFISCQPGTWNECHWYSWTFENATLGYQEVVPGDLGGCYCFNSGCSNAGFWPLKDQILRSLGAGVAAAMTKENPRYVAAKAEIEGTVIRYYGQNSGDCSLAQGPFSNFGQGSPEEFYQQSILLTQATEQETNSQAADPESFYNLITNSSAFTHSSRQTCQIKRDVFFDSNECKFKDNLVDQCIALENDPSCKLEQEILYDSDDNPIITYRDFSPTGAVPVPSCKVLPADGIQQCALRDLGGFGFIPSGFQQSGQNSFTLTFGWIGDDYWGGHCTKYNGYHSIYVKFPEVIESVNLSRAYWDDYIQVFVNDDLVMCGPDHCDDPDTLPSPGAACERSRTWDWHPNTDLTPYFNEEGQVDFHVKLAIDGAGELYVVIRFTLSETSEHSTCWDWWKIERTYVCDNLPPIQPDISRVGTIASSLQEDQGTVTFNDPASELNSLEIPGLTDGETCIKACKLKKAQDAAAASNTATSADYRFTPSSVTYIYRTCDGDNCPVEDGEEIVTPCQCLSEFNLAYGVMESMRQAAVDMICSDGTKKE